MAGRSLYFFSLYAQAHTAAVTGFGEVNERHSVTVLEGLENRGFTVTTKNWIADFEALYARKKAEHDIEKKKQINLGKAVF